MYFGFTKFNQLIPCGQIEWLISQVHRIYFSAKLILRKESCFCSSIIALNIVLFSVLPPWMVHIFSSQRKQVVNHNEKLVSI